MLAAFALTARAASAFTIHTSTSGAPAHWTAATVELLVDRSLLEIDEHAMGPVVAACATWDALTDAHAPQISLTAADADELGYRVGGHNQSTMRYAPHGSELAGDALGITVLTFDEQGTILDADVILNGGPGRHFAILGAGEKHDEEEGPYDLQNLLTHEMGHVFGLGEQPEIPAATMFPKSARGETSKRDLAEDDEAGVRSLYASAASGAASCAATRPSPSFGWAFDAMGVAGVFGAAFARRRRRGRAPVGRAILALGTAALVAGAPFFALAADRVAGHAGTPGDGPAPLRGRVTASSARWAGGLVVTRLLVHPRECDAGACEDLEVEGFGGTVGGLTQIVGHAPIPRVGAEVALILDGGRLRLLPRAPRPLSPPRTAPGDRVAVLLTPDRSSDPRRAAERVPAEVPAEVALDGGRVACTVENVSEGGLFIALASPPPVGARVLVTFELATGHAIEADVEVRWLRAGEEPGAGVRFVALEPDDAAAIREYVAERALLGGESALPGR